MSVDPRRNLHIVVSGRVQGVGYRAWTERTARELGLGGWVRNLPSGAVEIRCEGGRERVDQFVALLRRGPAAAVVTDLVLSEEPPQGLDGEFSIKR